MNDKTIISEVRSESNEDNNRDGVFSSLGIWGDLYVAGSGLIMAFGVGVVVLMALYEPWLLESGANWMEGPWYARGLSISVALWLSLGGAVLGAQIFLTGVRNAREKMNTEADQE